MGFNYPSKIQETLLPNLLRDPPQNVIAQIQPSGTGRTAVFVLAMLSKVDTSKMYPQVLCLSPTYESAKQTVEVATRMSKFCPEIKIKFAIGGVEMAKKSNKIEEHIIIGIPGEIMDWILQFKFFDTKKISVMVVDEADIIVATLRYQNQCIIIQK